MDRENHHFRELPSRRFEDERLTPEFRRFVARKILPRIERRLTGKKLDQQIDIARQVIHNLITTGLTGKCVADTRNTSKPGVRQRTKVWDAVIAAGFARACLGSESSGMDTRYRATKRLLLVRREWEVKLLVDQHLARSTQSLDATPHSLVYLHSGKVDLNTGHPLPKDKQKQPVSLLEYIEQNAQPGPDGKADPQAIANGVNHFRAIEDAIEKINFSNTSHTWQAFCFTPDGRRITFWPNVLLRQVHSGKLFRAVRLYSWGPLSGQNLTKEVRRSMLIDGEPTAELDFSGMATRMLYHLAGIEPKGDVYRPRKILPKFHSLANVSEAKKKLVRGFIKQVTNICWNVTSRHKAVGAARRLLREHEQAASLSKVLDLEGMSPDDLVGRIQRVHPRLKGRFFTEYGTVLMTIDGQIMFRILTTFAKAGKPALGIHDAVVCRASDVEFARETMRACYRKLMLHDPVINRVY